MMSDSLECLGPLDGRYAELAAPLRGCFSELALIRRRAMVEAEWLLRVNDIPQLRRMKINAGQRRAVRELASGLDLRGARRVKALERKTRHDVKALEYWLAGELEALGLGGEAVRRGKPSAGSPGAGWAAAAAAFRLHFVGH